MKKTQAERAQDYFGRNSKVAALVGTSDGFLFERKQDALSHSTTLADKSLTEFASNGEKSTLIVATGGNTTTEFLEQNAKDIIAAVDGISEVDVLQSYRDGENASTTPRKTVVEALENRIAELTSEE